MAKKEKQNKTKIALLQMQVGKDPNKNLVKALKWIEKAAKNKAKIICLPELFKTRYFCQSENISYFDYAEELDGQTITEIRKLSKKSGVVVIVPFFEKRAAGLYHNSIAIADSIGRFSGLYRKMHIPDDPAYYEKFYFTPGDLGYKAFNTKFGKIGTLICWDQWYPEAARLTALLGADIIFYPTAIGWHPAEKEQHGKAQYESWKTIQRAHAIANGVYVAAVNRVGLEKQSEDSQGIQFWGSSFVADPQGVILAEASSEKEEIIYAEIDFNRIEYIRRNWPFLRDRRIDSYSDIDKRFID